MYPADPALRTVRAPFLNACFNPAAAERLFAGSGHSFAELAALADASQPVPGFALRPRLTATHRERDAAGRDAATSSRGCPGSDRRLARRACRAHRPSRRARHRRAGRRRFDLQRRARQCRRASPRCSTSPSSYRRARRAAAPLAPVRLRHRRGARPARLALVRAAADRAARLDRRRSQLRHGAAALPADRRHRARRGGKQPRRRRARGRRGDGPAAGPGPLPRPQLLHPLRPICVHRGGHSGGRLQVRLRRRDAGGRDRARLAGDPLSQPRPTTAASRYSAPTRSGCTISSPRWRCASPMPRRGRAGTTTASSAASRAIEGECDGIALADRLLPLLAASAAWASRAALAAAGAGRRRSPPRCPAPGRWRRCASSPAITACAARRAIAPPPRRSATGCATTASRGSRSSRCPPTGGSSTAPSARGRAGTRARRNCGRAASAIASWAEQPISLAQDSVSRPRRGRAGRYRRGHERGRLSGQGGARPARPHLLAARARSRTSPSAATARRASSPGRRTSAPPGGARTRAWSAGAISRPSPSTRPSPSWSRRRGRAAGRSGCGAARAVRLRAEVDAGRTPERLSDPDRDHPRPAARPGDRLSPAISTIPIPAPTTMPRAARASSKWRARSAA